MRANRHRSDTREHIVESPPNAVGLLGPLLRVAPALADVARVRILAALAPGARSVREIWTHLGLPQPTVSHHLGLLQSAGLVSARRQGRFVFYSLAPGVSADDGGLTIRTAGLVIHVTRLLARSAAADRTVTPITPDPHVSTPAGSATARRER